MIVVSQPHQNSIAKRQAYGFAGILQNFFRFRLLACLSLIFLIPFLYPEDYDWQFITG
jgi:hypothetical protein